jgi:serine/alanine adding enzyme
MMTATRTDVRLLTGTALSEALPRLTNFVERGPLAHPEHDPMWLYALKDGLGHVPYAFEAVREGQTVGYLPMTFVKSALFGRFLVSLPYLNTSGINADDDAAKAALVEGAVALHRDLGTRHLELRHETPFDHAGFNGTRSNKVHMRLKLTDFPGPVWDSFPAKVRNQVRKGEKSGLTIHWGARDLLDEFYSVFAINMRDLGTPVYSKRLFQSILTYFPGDAELCIARHQGEPIAAALLVHGKGITEVPSASSLRQFNHLSANMMMYWHLIDRAIQRRQSIFDFGRATKDGNTYKFKKQWGAVESPAIWQYRMKGDAANLRADNPRYGRFIKMWQKLPVRVANVIGPQIVRGIP